MKKYLKENGNDVTERIKNQTTIYTPSKLEAVKLSEKHSSYHYPVKMVDEKAKTFEEGYAVPR